MKIQIQKPLFAWDCLEDHPALATIKQLLETIPDGKLLEGLKAARGKGRDDYPVRVLWGVVLLTIALRHTGFEACLGELRRNPALAKLIGIRSISDVPRGWNISRFLDVLGQEPHRVELEAIFNQMIQRLGEVVPDLGHATAGDSTSLKARRLRRDRPQEAEGGDAATAEVASAAEDTEKAEKIEYDEHGLPQPSGGRKEYKDEKGNITKVISWFGYKLHLLVDVKHEVSLVYRISSSKAGDNEVLPALVDQGQANLPQRRMQTLAYDKAADTGAARFHAMVGTVMIVHAAFATLLAAAPRREGTLGKMQLSPIAKALYERIAAERGKARPRGRRAGNRSEARQTRLFAA
jgi:hypothetical protein